MHFPDVTFSLTEVYFLGFSWGSKEGSPRKHTQSVQRPLLAAGPGVQGPFENSSGFTIKVKIYVFILLDRKICNGKNKGLALLDLISFKESLKESFTRSH